MQSVADGKFSTPAAAAKHFEICRSQMPKKQDSDPRPPQATFVTKMVTSGELHVEYTYEVGPLRGTSELAGEVRRRASRNFYNKQLALKELVALRLVAPDEVQGAMQGAIVASGPNDVLDEAPDETPGEAPHEAPDEASDTANATVVAVAAAAPTPGVPDDALGDSTGAWEEAEDGFDDLAAGASGNAFAIAPVDACGNISGENSAMAWDESDWSAIVAANARSTEQVARSKVAAQDTLTQLIIKRATHSTGVAKPNGRRMRSDGPALSESESVPHECLVDIHDVTAHCVSCGRSCDLGILLGIAHDLELGQTTMWGASHFRCQRVSRMLFIAEQYYYEHPSVKRVNIPCCYRDHLEQVLSGSAARAEAAAMSIWQNELDLDTVAERVRNSALELRFVEAAPALEIPLLNGTEHRMGKHFAFVAIRKDYVCVACDALRRLEGAALSPQLVANYKPYVLDEQAVRRVVAAAVVHGDGTVADPKALARHVNNGRLAMAIVQMDEATHEEAAAALPLQPPLTTKHAVETLRACLKHSAVSHVLLPNGAVLSPSAERLGNRSEAHSKGIEFDMISKQHFVRSGPAGGVFDATTIEAVLSEHDDVRSYAAREWRDEIDFIAPAASQHGVRTLAMNYLSGEKARKRRRANGSVLQTDGINQPRLRLLTPPLRGIEMDSKALRELSNDEEYLKRVRIPQQEAAGDCLLTIRHFGYGGEALNSNRTGNPFAKASSTVVRVCSQSESYRSASRYMATSTRTSANCGWLDVHADGDTLEPTVELMTVRWAACLDGMTDHSKRETLSQARGPQPLLSTSAWLRTSVAFDVAPCSGVGLVAGTESEHAVPQPLANMLGGLDVERGLTRSYAQSYRPDHQCEHDLPYFDAAAQRRNVGLRSDALPPGLPLSAGVVLPTEAAGAREVARGGRSNQRGPAHNLRRQPQQQEYFVAGEANAIVHGLQADRAAAARGDRINHNTGTAY